MLQRLIALAVHMRNNLNELKSHAAALISVCGITDTH